MTDAALPPLPTGTSSFETLRCRGQIYVDKTALIHELASRPEKFFLTRPRRFGKSLLVSTFASLFKNGLKHFSGLAMEKLWKDRTYSVVEIDFSKAKGFNSFEDFEEKARSVVVRAFARAGFVLDQSQASDWIGQISDWMEGLPANSLVLLIDEYDAPHTECLGDKELFDKIRKFFAGFYANVKSNDACLRFMFMTGIAKFNQTGIFSELNNFTDISLDPMYGTLLGYTEDDIRRYFSGYLQRAAGALRLSEERTLELLRENYDGYCFDDEAAQHLYAPWSVLNFFSRPSRGFLNYWAKSGGALTLLQKYLHSHALRTPSEYAVDQLVKYSDLDCSTDLEHINDLALLTQAGYLTIKKRGLNSFWVGYPNKEVAVTLAELYSAKLLHDRDLTAIKADAIVPALNQGDVQKLFESANRAFAALDYVRFPITEEKLCQSYLQIFIAGAGFSVTVERHGASGRSDLEIETERLHWVIELKFQRTGQNADALLSDAVKQIRDRNYGAASARRLVRAAAVFSEEKRAFTCWRNADEQAFPLERHGRIRRPPSRMAWEGIQDDSSLKFK